MAEGRLSRWSRLKSKGGADPREEKQVEAEKKAAVETAEPDNEFARLPGGARRTRFVPAMAPLAPEPEDDDDDMTRGVGHWDPDEADRAPGLAADGDESEAPARAADVIEEDLFADIPEQEMTDEERETVAALPPLESLNSDSDFTPFLRDGVPEFMKRRALRLLWRLNPFFNVRDGLNDYDEDFNVIDKIIDGLTGNYQVGRGHLSEKELRDMMPEEARRAFDEEEPELPDDADGEGDADSGRGDGTEKNPSSGQGDAAGDVGGQNHAAGEPGTDSDDEIGDGEDDV